MNIFVVDKNPFVAARMLCDRHVVKMIVETAQLLCTVFEKAPYKPTHVNHPCAIWARTSKLNYQWLLSHGLTLCYEYTRRYGKTHKSMSVITWCARKSSKLKFKYKELTPFAKCVPEEFKHLPVVQAYREYYVADKYEFATWKHPTTAPFWWPFPPR